MTRPERTFSWPGIPCGIRKTRVGIQIGERVLKIVVANKGGKKWNIVKEIVSPLPEGAVKNGEVLRADLLGFALKDALLKNGIRIKKASVFLEELPFFIRQIHLPKMTEKERKRAVEYRMKLELPVETSEWIIRYFPLAGGKEENGSQGHYIVLAVSRHAVEKAVEALHAAGLSVLAFDLEPLAFYRGLKAKGENIDLKDATLLVRADTRRIMLAVFVNGEFVYSRYLPLSEKQKDWAVEIERTILGWNRLHRNHRIENVILCGEKGLWEHVKEHIEAFLPLSVQIMTSPFAACLGVAMKEADPVHFYSDQGFLSRWKKHQPFYRNIVFMIPLLFAGYLLYQYSFYVSLKKEIALLETNLNAQRETQQLVEEKQRLLGMTRELEKKTEQIRQQHIRAAELLDRIAMDQPGGIVITQIDLAKNTIRLSGQAEGKEEVILFLKNLQKDPEFKRIQLVQAHRSESGLNFTLQFDH